MRAILIDPHAPYTNRRETTFESMAEARRRLPGWRWFIDGREIDEGEESDRAVGLPDVGDPVNIALLAVGIVAAVIAGMLAEKAASSALAAASRESDEDSRSASWLRGQQATGGRGLAIPIVAGRFRIQGVPISARTEAPPFGIEDGEVLTTQVAWCEGPVHSIGDVTAEPYGEADQLGYLLESQRPIVVRSIPDGLRHGGVELTEKGTEVSVRLGHDAQSRTPRAQQTSATIAVGEVLAEQDAQVVVQVTEALVDVVRIVVDCPQGLYQLVGGQRQPYTVTIQVESRVSGQGSAWTRHPDWTFARATPRAFAQWYTLVLGQPREGPYEVRLTRLTPAGDPQTVVSYAQVRHVEAALYEQLTHPGLALTEISRLGTAATADHSLDFSCVVEGWLVRAWTSVTRTWSDETYGPTGIYQFPVGRNPAWFAAKVVLDESAGLGHELRRSLGGTGGEELDLGQWERWAVMCDQPNPSDPTRALFEINAAYDVRRPALQRLLEIFRAGRAVPVIDGGRLTVIFEWRDAFTRGHVTVPAREPFQVIGTSQVPKAEIRFRSRAQRPNAVEIEYFDEDRDFGPDLVRVWDENRLSVPYTGAPARMVSQRHSGSGITNRVRARREGWYRLQWEALAEVECALEGGLPFATLLVGDLFRLVHECWYPDADTVPAAGMRAITDSPDTPVSAIAFDRTVTASVARTGTVIFVAEPDGYCRVLSVDGTGSWSPGDPVPLWDPAANGGAGAVASVKVAHGAAAYRGAWGKLERTMRVTNVTIDTMNAVRLEAVEWPEAAFDEPPASVLEDSGSTLPMTAGDEQPGVAQPVAAAPEQPVVETSAPTGAPAASWRHVAGASDRPRGPTRVWVQSGEGDWDLAAETRGAAVDLSDLPRGHVYQVAVGAPGRTGTYPSPAVLTPASIVIPEVAGSQPVAPAGVLSAVTSGQSGGAARVSWAPVPGAVRYEIRRTTSRWIDAPLIWAGDSTEADLRLEPGDHALAVAGLSASGFVGEASRLSVAVPEAVTELASVEAGTHDGTEATADGIELQAHRVDGTYTLNECDAAVDADTDLLWSLTVGGGGRFDVPWSEAVEEPMGLLNGMLADGMPATALRPGLLVEGDATSGDPDTLTASDRDDQHLGNRGTVGQRVSFTTEVRTYSAGKWNDWQRYRGPFREAATKMQARVVLRRESRHWRAILETATARASL